MGLPVSRFRLNPVNELLTGRKIGELTGAAHHHLRVAGHCLQDMGIGLPVDAEGLFAEQVLAGLDDIHIDLLMQHMG